MRWSVPQRRVIVASIIGATALSHRSGGQVQVPASKPATESRVQLAARARVADSLGRREEAFVLRSRLSDGDFEVGDVIIASYEGPQLGLNRRDSLVVIAGRIIQLQPPLGDLDLHGVLRAEIADSITNRVAKYFKNEVVRVTPLLRLSVTGGARVPGFYQFRPDVPLSDVIMRAGGQGTGADLSKVTVKRGDQTLWSSTDVQTALTEGLTIEQLNLEAGDEVAIAVVNAAAKPVWQYLLQVGSALATGLLVNYLFRRR